MIVAIAIYVAILNHHKGNQKIHCNKTQSEYSNSRKKLNISATLNTSVNPCHNFYRYACDQYMQKHPLQLDETHWSPFEEILTKNLYLIHKSILNLTVSKPNLHVNCSQSQGMTPIHKLKIFYNSCLDITMIDRLDSWPLINLIHQLNLPGSPNHIVNNMCKHVFHSKKTLISSSQHFHRILTVSLKWNVPTLFNFITHTDGTNSSRELLQV